MICGVSKKKITPPVELLPNLNGLSGVTFTEVLDDLYVRVLVLGDEQKKILFVVFDLDKVPYPEKYLPELSVRTRIPEECISLLSIHTHTAPITGWRPNEGPNFIERKPEHIQKATHEYEEFLEQIVYEAADEAMSALQPVRIGWGQGESYININRVEEYIVRKEDGSKESVYGLGQNHAADVDRSLFVLKVEDLNGNMVACLANYAVHNCMLIGNRCAKDGGTLLSGDLCGTVTQLIEENHPGCVAFWTSGAAGDINPIMMNQIFYPDPRTGEQAVLDVPVGDTTPLIMLKILSTRHYVDILRVLERITCEDDSSMVDGAVKCLEMPGNGEPYRIRVHMSRIGELGIWGMSGELYSSLGKAIKEGVPGGTHVIMNHDASLLVDSGYIFDDETFMLGEKVKLPGRRNHVMLPGYVKGALLEATAEMWKTSH